MSKKLTPLPPGAYTVTIDRVRKVRNKQQKRIHMTVVEDGRKLSTTINPEPYTELRPPEPKDGSCVWYRGWECSYEPDRAHWTGEGYTAYKGGCDLDAPQAHGVTWDALLEAVDDEEDA